MLSRKDFLKLSGLASGALLFYPVRSIVEHFNEKESEKLNLLFEASEVPELKRRLELPIFKKFWNEMLNANLEEDRKFLETGIQFNNQIRHLPRVDQILQREAFVYVITGDKKRSEMAKLALEKILQFKKWDYFVEAGKHVIGLQRAPFTTQSIVLTYEWIEDLLSDETKKEIFVQLPEKGCEPCYRSLWGMLNKEKVVGWGFDPESSYYEERDMRKWPWILSRTNLRAVPMSALGLGAIFLEGRHPRVPEWMNVVKQTYYEFYDMFEKDGSYPEGSGYCNYTASELILFLNILERKKKEDWSDKINWQGVMDFFLMTLMPSNQYPKGHINFGDGGGGFWSDVGYWVAKKYRDGRAQFTAKHHSRGDRIFSVIFYDPTVETIKPKQKWFYRHFDIDWVVVSTGFEKDDFVVAMRSGGPANHENADRNSIILKCYAENLLVDNWHPPYDHKHPAWALRTSPAHNTVLIDNKGHQYHDGLEGTNASLAEAKVMKENKTDNYVIVTSDASQAYQLINDNVKNVIRTFLAVPEMKLILVVDCLMTKEQPTNFRARWFVDNEDKNGKIEIDGKKFTFLRPQAKLVGVCDSDHEVQLVRDTFPVPEEHGVYPFMDVAAQQAGKKVVLITVAAAIRNDDPLPICNLRKVSNGWVLIAKNNRQKMQVNIATMNIYPDLSVVM
ncbi:MAG: heparinase II/III family protein [bacterium]|nr:MAG: heparinase II/III family protein [bacterium]